MISMSNSFFFSKYIYNSIFLEGNGERPPEDVGGLWGFKEYLRIMEDEKDPSHQDMKAWADSQKERKLSSENCQLTPNTIGIGG